MRVLAANRNLRKDPGKSSRGHAFSANSAGCKRPQDLFQVESFKKRGRGRIPHDARKQDGPGKMLIYLVIRGS